MEVRFTDSLFRYIPGWLHRICGYATVHAFVGQRHFIEFKCLLCADDGAGVHSDPRKVGRGWIANIRQVA